MGDPGWWGTIVAGAVGIPAWIGVSAAWVKAGQADGRAERAEERAEEALEQYRRIADALDQPGSTTSGRPAASFQLEWRGGELYSLRNLGPEKATNVVLDAAQISVIRGHPQGVELSPLEGVEFLMAGSMGNPVPSQVQVSCDQIEEPAIVPVPSKAPVLRTNRGYGIQK